MNDLLEAAEVRILRLQPGDEIIVKVGNSRISEDTLRRLKVATEERWPGHRVTILHESVDLEVLRQ